MRERFRCVIVTAMVAIGSITLTSHIGIAQPASPTPSALPTCGAGSAVSPRASPAATSVASPPTEGPILQLVADVSLPGTASRFDYQSLDETTGRLVIAH